MLSTLLLACHIIVSFSLIVLILIQKGKSIDMMSPVSGASQTLFGSQGASAFITRLTGIVGFLFFATSLSLHILASPENQKGAWAILNKAVSVGQKSSKQSNQ